MVPEKVRTSRHFRSRLSQSRRGNVIVVRVQSDDSAVSPVLHVAGSRRRSTAKNGSLTRRGRAWAWVRRARQVPVALAGLLIGALVPWAVNTYAPLTVEKATATPAVHISAGIDSGVLDDGWTMALPVMKSAQDVPKATKSCADFRQWASLQGAYDSKTSSLLVTFRGTRIEPVVVTGIRVVIEKKDDPFSALKLNCPSAGAGSTIPVALLLDEPTPVLREQKSDQSLGYSWFTKNSLTLKQGEIVTFAVEAYAFKAAYKWHLEALVRSGDRQSVVPIEGSYVTTAEISSYGSNWMWDWASSPEKLVTN